MTTGHAGTVTPIDARRRRRAAAASELPARLVDTSAERGLLSAVMMARRGYDAAVDRGVRADDFHAPKHRRLWSAVAAVYATPDVPHALPELVTQQLDAMGDTTSLVELSELFGDITYSSHDAASLGRVVVKLAVDREMFTSTVMLRSALEAGDDAAAADARNRLAAAEQRSRIGAPDPLSNYRERNGTMEWLRPGPSGSWEPLANWCGRITAELVAADDPTRKLEWEAVAQLPGEEPVTVPLKVDELDKAAAILRAQLGPRAKIAPGGRTIAEHVLSAVQSLSGPVPRLALYDRVGLVALEDGRWVYVDAAGAHGVAGLVDGVRTRLVEALSLYRLPVGDELVPLADCVAAVERFRGLGNAGAPIDHVTVPLLGARLTALALDGPAGFGVQLLADNGVGKSAIAACFGGFYGTGWRHDRLPVPARSGTSLAMQRIAAAIRDAVLVVDDVPLSTSGANRRAREDVAAAAHATANGAGRQALRRDGEMRESRPVEALTLYTGEQVAAVDQAGESRLLVLDVKRSEFTLRELADDGTSGAGPAAAGLTAVQADVAAGRLASFHAHQLRWFLGDVDGARRFADVEVSRLRMAPSEATHPRHADHLAKLGAGVELHLSHLVDAGILTEAEAEADWRRRCWPALLEAARRQTLPPEMGPGPKMLRHLADVIASRGAYLTSRTGGIPDDWQAWGWEGETRDGARHGSGPVVGLVDDDGTVHLFPEVALKAADQLGAAIDDPIGAPSRVVSRSLAEAGLIVQPSSDGRHMRTKLRHGVGERSRVLTLTGTGAQMLAGIEPDEPPRPAPAVPELHLRHPGAPGWRSVSAPALDVERWAELVALLDTAPDEVVERVDGVFADAGWPTPRTLVLDELSAELRAQLGEWLPDGIRWLGAAVGIGSASAPVGPVEAPEAVEAPDTPGGGERGAQRPTAGARKALKGRSWSDRYCYAATDGTRLYLDDGEIITGGPWSDASAMVDMARSAAGGRELVVFVHESGHEALGLPERPGGRRSDGLHRLAWVAAAAGDTRRVDDLGDTGGAVLTSTDGTKAHIVFPGFGGFDRTASPDELLEAVRLLCDALGFGYLHSAPSTVHNLVTWSQGRTRGPIPPAGPEPDLDGGWVDSACAVPGNVWTADVDELGDVHGRHVRTYDRRGSYLSALRGVELPEGAWGHRPGPFPLDGSKLPAGYWQVSRARLAQLVPAGMPDPFARHGRPRGDTVWITTPLAQLAGELARESGEALIVDQAWLAELRTRRLDTTAATIAAARSTLEAAAATSPAAAVALRTLKDGYAGAVAWFEHAGRPVSHPLARPAWRRTIIDRFSANTWRGLRKAVDAGAELVALGDVDTAAVLVDGPADDPPGLDLSPQLGKWKAKGDPVAAADAVEALRAGGGRALLRLTEEGADDA